MHRLIALVLGVAVTVALCGCGGAKPDPLLGAARQSQYQQIAIVVAPGPGADPQYVPIVLAEVQKMAHSRLTLLKRVDYPSGVAVDTSVSPPKPTIGPNLAGLDGLICLVYSSSGSNVIMDYHMFDLKTGQQVWTTRLQKAGGDLKQRLMGHGYWAPSIIKNQFYGGK